MFSHFNVKLDFIDFLKDYHEFGQEVLKRNKTRLYKALDHYTDGNGIIDGGRLQEDWFSTIPVDVFISHSHKDLDIAISLAGWLQTEFGLSSFVDSCLWGYIENLLAEINDKYNCIHIDPNGTKTYNHQGAIDASTHVDAMLSMSLNKMLQHSEAIFFLSTENSIVKSQNYPGDLNTYSPWIYLELCLANTSAITIPERLKSKYRTDELGHPLLEHKLLVQYPVELTKFSNLDSDTLLHWHSAWKHRDVGAQKINHPLDILYKEKK